MSDPDSSRRLRSAPVRVAAALLPLVLLGCGVGLFGFSAAGQPWIAIAWTVLAVAVPVAVLLLFRRSRGHRLRVAVAVVVVLDVATIVLPLVFAARAATPRWQVPLGEPTVDLVAAAGRLYATGHQQVRIVGTTGPETGHEIAAVSVGRDATAVVTTDGAVWTMQPGVAARLSDRDGRDLWKFPVPAEADDGRVLLHARGRTPAGEPITVLRWCTRGGCVLVALDDSGKRRWVRHTAALRLYQEGGATEVRTTRSWPLRPAGISQVPSTPMIVLSGGGGAVLDLTTGADARTWAGARSLATASDGTFVLTGEQHPVVSAEAADGTVRWTTPAAECAGDLELHPRWVTCADANGVTAVLDRSTGALATLPPAGSARRELVGDTVVVAGDGVTGWSTSGEQLWHSSGRLVTDQFGDDGLVVWTTSLNPYSFDAGLAGLGRPVLDARTGEPVLRLRATGATPSPVTWVPVADGYAVAQDTELRWYPAH